MSTQKKLIVRLMGGLGNQLFTYSVARRLALINEAELIVDACTGFTRDIRFKRHYALQNFALPVRLANAQEQLEPFERLRRGRLKWLSRRKAFESRNYVEQEKLGFDQRLLDLRFKSTLFLEGYWQSERYFKDVEKTIRKDLEITPPTDDKNQQVAANILQKNSVALHIRWFDSPGQDSEYNLSSSYYEQAIEWMENRLDSPYYFVFSDNPQAAQEKVNLPKDRVCYISHNQTDESNYADLWLMSQCKHFITANSTFSWWGAWLADYPEKIVITPSVDLRSGLITAWGFEGLIPESWISI
jgi:hypothetical protein